MSGCGSTAHGPTNEPALRVSLTLPLRWASKSAYAAPDRLTTHLAHGHAAMRARGRLSARSYPRARTADVGRCWRSQDSGLEKQSVASADRGSRRAKLGAVASFVTTSRSKHEATHLAQKHSRTGNVGGFTHPWRSIGDKDLKRGSIVSKQERWKGRDFLKSTNARVGLG